MDSESSNETIVKMNSTAESKDVEPVKTLESSRKNSKGDKLRKKDDKSVEQVLKALNSLQTTEEKLAAMCKKYADIVDENRKLQLAAKQGEKKCCVLQREKEQLQTEHSKAVLSRSRLESLCRELQRQNKAIKEESLQKVREEEEKRKEVSAKFQGTLNEITTLMQQNVEKNSKLKEENVEMAQRFGKLLEQYEIREQQVEKLVEQIHIETELGEARIAKAKMEMASEKEAMLREKQTLLLELEACKGEIRSLQENDIKLRGQLNLYTEKYDEFKTALTRSSEIFNSFKGEMEKMSKNICKLEKETNSWKQRWERSHQALLEMAADKQQRDGELALANRRLTQMQALCRTLQAERTTMLAQLRGSETGKDAEKGDESAKELSEEKGLEGTASKENKESVSEMESKPSDPASGVNVETNGGASAVSGESNANEMKEVGDRVAEGVNEKKEQNVKGSSSESGDGTPQVAVEDPSSDVKTLVPIASDAKGEEVGAVGNSNQVASKSSDPILPSEDNKSSSTAMNECKPANNALLDDPSVKIDDSPCVTSLPTSINDSTSEDVGTADFGLEKESIMEELNSLKMKLDSCIISDISPPAIESNDKALVVGDKAADKVEGSKAQPEIPANLNVSGQANSVQPEVMSNSTPIIEPIGKELPCENICDISASISADMKTLSLDVCDTRTALTADVTALEMKSKEITGVDSNIIAEAADVGVGNLINSQEKCKSESEVLAGEKPITKNVSPSTGAKKPDAQVNPKKGKESSRKRKR
ncbi:alpha-taxilin [Ischnura elegans]|uniref:alpha-taxilin n=1 Tax=Ischnura elegans TaxID=197161 RepID=UPI001ED87908|nr:alpha-taxilin [Ischnura elegans]XP_046398646.1 alpha-taxilin [Ischnura elegans]